MELGAIEDFLVQAFFLAALLSAAPLVCSMLVGVAVSIVQAATQIQEQTLSYVPKAAAVAAVLYWGGGYFLRELTEFLAALLLSIERFSGGGPW